MQLKEEDVQLVFQYLMENNPDELEKMGEDGFIQFLQNLKPEEYEQIKSTATKQAEVEEFKKGGKLNYLKKLKNGKKCKCGCEIKTFKAENGGLIEKCSCGCKPKHENGGVIKFKPGGLIDLVANPRYHKRENITEYYTKDKGKFTEKLGIMYDSEGRVILTPKFNYPNYPTKTVYNIAKEGETPHIVDKQWFQNRYDQKILKEAKESGMKQPGLFRGNAGWVDYHTKQDSDGFLYADIPYDGNKNFTVFSNGSTFYGDKKIPQRTIASFYPKNTKFVGGDKYYEDVSGYDHMTTEEYQAAKARSRIAMRNNPNLKVGDPLPTETTPTTSKQSTTPNTKQHTVTTKPNPDVSIYDYMVSHGQSGRYNDRVKLANELGIKGYKGTADQNILMLNALKNRNTQTVTPPKQEEPASKFTVVLPTTSDSTETQPKYVKPRYNNSSEIFKCGGSVKKKLIKKKK